MASLLETDFSPDEIDQAYLDAQRELCERSFRLFVPRAWPIIEPQPFIGGWHVDAICDHLEAVEKGQIRNLLINIPPRCSKSILVCVLWFCWAWTRNPESKWLFSTYSQKLTVRDSLKCRTLITSPWYQELWGSRFRLATDQNEKMRFDNDQMGYRIATSVDGLGTGEGGDFIVCDDPHNVKEGTSEAILEKVWYWWSQAMGNRANDKKTVRRVVIQQRVNVDDLSGRLLETGQWEHLCLPMRFERDRKCTTTLIVDGRPWEDPRTEEGEPLCEARFGEKELAEMEIEYQAYGVAAQLQQDPKSDINAEWPAEYFDGEIWFTRWPRDDDFQFKIMALDPSLGRTDDSDYSAIIKLGLHNDGLMYVDADVQRRPTTKIVRDAIALARSFGPAFLYVEINGFQELLEAEIVRASQEEGFMLPAVGIQNTITSKKVRIRTLGPYLARHRFRFLKGSPGVELLMKQLKQFPNAKHDDAPDALEMALRMTRTLWGQLREE